MQDHLLRLSLSASVPVPLYIMQLKAKGGIDKGDIERAQKVLDILGEKRDILLYGGGKKGEVASIFNELSRVIAVLSFCPGGVTVFNEHYEAYPNAQTTNERLENALSNLAKAVEGLCKK